MQGDVTGQLHTTAAVKTARQSLVDPYYVKDATCPTERVRWVKREVPELGNGQKHYVEAPENWSERSVSISAIHYLAPQDHDSIRGLILRVTDALFGWAVEDGTFRDPEAGQVFKHELTYILLNRIASFNSPVYYNIGTCQEPQCSACFINSVDDTMESITDLAKREARIFQSGSGAGANWSRLRSSHESVRDQGNSSGPVPFMVAHDSLASKIKSGGRKRRAARMDILDANHPDIFAFVRDKADTEKIAHILAKQGWSTDMTDPQSTCNILPHQSTNVSVRIPDAFMEAALSDSDWDLFYRNQEGVQRTVSAKDLLREIAQACWECGDPGVQFASTIKAWSLIQDIHELRGSNPCGEFIGRDDTSCNLASINVMPPGRDPLSLDEVRHISRVFITAMDTIVGHAGYPDPRITANTRADRDLGLGWSNLGALCMANGYPYDSDEARELVSTIVSTTTAAAYEQSIELGRVHGPFERAAECARGIVNVFKRHRDAARGVDGMDAETLQTWDQLVSCAERGEFSRNASVTLCAPCGTIGLWMDCDTTGGEPGIAVKSTKKLSYGGELNMHLRCVEPGLKALGYSDGIVAAVLDQIDQEGHVEGLVQEEHLAVFDTALNSGPSQRAISYMGHIKMLAAMQPHLSMAISKTVNLPNEITVEEIQRCYIDAWKMGVKNLALYRDGSKAAQAVYAYRAEKAKELRWGDRKKLPKTRQSITHKIDLGGTEAYVHVGLYPDGKVGEIYFTANLGSTLDGMLDSIAKGLSYALQYGAPLEALIDKYKSTKFAPDGWAQIGDESRYFSSIMDYVFSWIESEFCQKAAAEGEIEKAVRSIIVDDRTSPRDGARGVICPNCQNMMFPNGGSNCYLCHSCGGTSGGCG